MLSDASDLTDLSSDDNTGRKLTSKESAKKKTTYRLRNVLKPGRTTQYTARALYDQIHDNDIDLEPEYQRDIVWSEAKQIGLIDSIFRNFYIPPIIFAVTTEDDGSEKRVCIDGKQRLTSIQRFIGGLIPHRDPFTNEKLWFVDSTSGPKRKLLPPQYKTLFQNKQIVCVEYSDLPPDLEREVFQRVQMGMALTTAEKLQAISGRWPDFVREVTNEYLLGPDGLCENMDLNRARARDFQNLAQTIYCIDQLPEHIHGTTMQLEKWLSEAEGPSEATRARIHDVFRIFRDLARHNQLRTTLRKPSRVAPVEFIMIGVMIAIFKDRLSLPQLSQAIGILRTETRATYIDIRANSKVFKTMFNIISTEITVSKMKETPGLPVAGSLPGALPVRSGKRKRSESNDSRSFDEGVVHGKESMSKAPRPSATPAVPINPFSSPQVVSSSDYDIKETTNNVSSAHPVASSSRSSTPHFASTGPGRFARIQAAKAQAALISNEPDSGSGSGSGSAAGPSTTVSVVTPHLSTSETLPPRPPNLGFRQQDPNPLEAILMGISPQETYSSLSHSTAHPGSPVQRRRSMPQIASDRIPIPTNGGLVAGSSRQGYQAHQAHDGRRHESSHSPTNDRNDRGAYRGHHGYEDRHGQIGGSHRVPQTHDARHDRKDGSAYRGHHEFDDRHDLNESRDRGLDRWDDGRSGHPSRGPPYSKGPDTGWERVPDRTAHNFGKGPGQ